MPPRNNLPKIKGGNTASSFPTVHYAPKSTLSGGSRGVQRSQLGGLRFLKEVPVESVGPMTMITMVLLVVVLGLISYILYLIYRQQSEKPEVIAPTTMFTLGGMSTQNEDPVRDLYAPPLRNDGVYFPKDSASLSSNPSTTPVATLGRHMWSGDIRGLPGTVQLSGLPINVRTRGFQPDFSQVGILVYDRESSSTERAKESSLSLTPTATSEMLSNSNIRDNLILPLMGRRVMNGRDKYQYYTVSNTGSLTTKLPVKVRGRNCINEYGCDEIMNGDVIYVDGYNRPFRTTVYENSTFSYIPVL